MAEYYTSSSSYYVMTAEQFSALCSALSEDVYHLGHFVITYKGHEQYAIDLNDVTFVEGVDYEMGDLLFDLQGYPYHTLKWSFQLSGGIIY